MQAYPCPCCGYLTLGLRPPGTYLICPVCFWEDDGVQFEDPLFWGGANIVCLDDAQRNYKEFGACCKEDLPHVRAPFASEYAPDPNT
jgi:Cysteine-rich CPCC